MKLSTLLAVLRGLTNQQVDNMFVGSSANQDVRQHQSPGGWTGIISSFRCFLYFLLVFVSVFVYLTRTTNPLITTFSGEFQRIVAFPTTTEVLQELSNRRYACPLVQLCGRQVQLRRRWLEVQARQASTSTRAACLQTNPTTAITTASSDVIGCFAYIAFC